MFSPILSKTIVCDGYIIGLENLHLKCF